MKKNILITTGGSGGHVIPAMILYDHLSKETNVTISTDKRGLRYLDKDNYKFNVIKFIGRLILTHFFFPVLGSSQCTEF